MNERTKKIELLRQLQAGTLTVAEFIEQSGRNVYPSTNEPMMKMAKRFGWSISRGFIKAPDELSDEEFNFLLELAREEVQESQTINE